MSKVPTTKEDMKERIVAACRSVTPEMLRRVRESIQKRLQKCIEVDGRQFEHLISSLHFILPFSGIKNVKINSF